MGQPWASARELLETAAAGDAARVAELAQELARAVLATPAFALATRALAGGPHAVVAAIELAALVLRSVPASAEEAAS